MRSGLLTIGLVVLLLYLLETPKAPPSVPVPEYDRAAFSGWVDVDGDCQSTRSEMLIAASKAAVRLSGNGCTVQAGKWTDPYSGRVIADASAVHIDHLVPLKWAWEHGASEWSDAKRDRFALDPANLLIASARLNTSKGARGPMEWMPPDRGIHCDYLSEFEDIVTAYQLRVDSFWRDWMRDAKGTACQGDGQV